MKKGGREFPTPLGRQSPEGSVRSPGVGQAQAHKSPATRGFRLLLLERLLRLLLQDGNEIPLDAAQTLPDVDEHLSRAHRLRVIRLLWVIHRDDVLANNVDH